MRIQCTSCKATAKIPAEKEGAKVRCPSCGHVYVARPMGSRGSTRAKSNDSRMMIFGGVGLAGVFLLMMVSSGGDEVEITEADELPELVEEVVLEDLTGWDSPLVKETRNIHKAAFERDKIKLLRALAMDRVYARVKTTEEREVFPGDWGVLSKDDQFTFEEELLNGMLAYEPSNLVAGWKPFDGEILVEEDSLATVRITLEPRDTELGVQTRHIDWRFIKEKGKWKAWKWERWISPAEKRGALVARASSTKKVTLEDGSKVFEAEPGPLEWDINTTAEQRAQIERLIGTLCAPDTRGGDLFNARQELVAICRPAIPPLLTKFYEIDLEGFESYENQTAAMQVHQVLTEITGYITTFKAHEALGATDERRSSGVRQWFSWYHRRYKRFSCETEVKTEEAEPGLLFEPKTEQERRDYERALREAGNN